jgi:hypothetical protein
METTRYFWSYFAQFFLEWEIFRTKVVEEIKTHILCSVTFFFSENRAVYEIMWKNTLLPEQVPLTTWRMLIPCSITRATDAQSEYVLLTVFPLEQRLTNALQFCDFTYYISCLDREYCRVPSSPWRHWEHIYMHRKICFQIYLSQCS